MVRVEDSNLKKNIKARLQNGKNMSQITIFVKTTKTSDILKTTF